MTNTSTNTPGSGSPVQRLVGHALECPLCQCRVQTGHEMRMTDDCQCSKETMARKISSMQNVVFEARRDREHFCASSDKVREQLAARVRYLETKWNEAIEVLVDCAYQFLMGDENDPQIIRHSFMSTEESLCEFLVENSRMERVRNGVFRMLPNVINPVCGSADSDEVPNAQDDRAGDQP